MLDTSQNLIVINGCIRTSQIESCRYEAPNRYYIVFAGGPKEYVYRGNKVLWLKNPESLNPEDYRLVHNSRRLTHIAKIPVLKIVATTHIYADLVSTKKRETINAFLRFIRL